MPRRHSRREAVVLTFSRASLWLAAMGACVLVLGFGLGGYSLGRDTTKSSADNPATAVAAAAKVSAVRPAAVVTPPAAPPPVVPANPAHALSPEPDTSSAEADDPATDEPPVSGELAVTDQPEAEEPPAPAVNFQKPPRKGYGIQLGAFESEQEATDFAETYREALKDMPVHIVTVSLKKRGTWHRVRVGKFSSKRKAEKARKKLPAVLADASISVSYP